MELIDEEELAPDGQDTTPVAYLMVPDARALRNLLSLWERWQRGQLQHGETPWRDVFALLRNLRPWGPADRVQETDANILAQEIDGLADEHSVKLEIELVFRANEQVGRDHEEEVRAYVLGRGGRIISRSRIVDIAYHALLADLPVPLVREVIQRLPGGATGLEPVMYIRPQSVATSIELADAEEAGRAPSDGQFGSPILALLDGVPVAAHPLLERHLSIDDQFGLEPRTPVSDRVHGTAMASLIVHGDRNRAELPLPRRVHVVPVLGAGDAFPDDRLVIDLIYTAMVRMLDGPQATAPEVLLVNLSLGNRRRPFHGQLSPWARLLDRLSYRFGVLFLVSAGNNTGQFGIPAFANRIALEDAPAGERSRETLRAIGNVVGERTVFAPAETVNGLTIGACNSDSVPPALRVAARVNIDPYGDLVISNPSSALGPGFASAVKPDVLMPGGREYLRVVRSDPYVEVQPAGPSRVAGLKVAAPPRGGIENPDGYTSGTSPATALAARTCHRVHDALEGTYGDRFLQLPKLQRAVLLKAIFAHPARWPDETANLIRAVIGPPDSKHNVRQKDNIRRFLGYGIVDADDAVACTDDRATFWAAGTLDKNKISTVSVPVPVAIGGQARPHALWATLAWFTPVSPGRKSYRSVRLKLLEPADLGALSVAAHSNQPDRNQTSKGTLFTRSWSGDKAPAVGANMSIDLTVQRDPDQGADIDEPVPFGLAVTLTMPGIIEVYEQVRQRLAVLERARA